jgi:hypothetical protein
VAEAPELEKATEANEPAAEAASLPFPAVESQGGGKKKKNGKGKNK